ncbi:MAG TPA: methyltransferase domain-containing protein [Nitrososphaerales archaeon]|nr:methyltransferase domain-containing protein [Nitrososphaerales archaeon]
MKQRRPGLQDKWAYVVNSLQVIIPSYERASSRISLFADRRMRSEAVSFATVKGGLMLDLGAGPGTMSRGVSRAGGDPVLLDASRAMLKCSGYPNAVQGVFEYLPFRREAFDGAVSGFAVRDAHDLRTALSQVASVLKPGARLAICDLGKPDGVVREVLVGYYLRVVPSIIGLATTGRVGLRYASLYDTYVLVLRNSDLVALLERYLGPTTLHEMQAGGAIVVKCTRRTQ